MIVLVVALVVLAFDQATKWWATRELSDGSVMRAIPGWLQFRLTQNSGAAFSLGTGASWLFTLIAIGVCVGIVVLSRHLGSLAWAICLGLVLGGASGNLIDRLLNDGHVVDFIEYLKFPVIAFPIFNIADSAIVSASVFIVILGMKNIPLGGHSATEDVAAPAAELIESEEDVAADSQHANPNKKTVEEKNFDRASSDSAKESAPAAELIESEEDVAKGDREHG